MTHTFVPAILTDSPDELIRVVHILERIGVRRAHLDVCDGVFVPSRTIDGHDELRRICSDLRWDIHLMVQDPEHYMAQWDAVKCAQRFIVHVEVAPSLTDLVRHCHGRDRELWAAINPETPIEKLYGHKVPPDGVTFMTVHPGEQGRAFLPDVLPRIAAFHTEHPELPLMVDGGVVPHTARLCAAAGASVLVTGSFILKSLDPARALRELSDGVR